MLIHDLATRPPCEIILVGEAVSVSPPAPTVLRSIDGGRSVVAIAPPPGASRLRRVIAAGPTLVVAGEDSAGAAALFRTTDGGRSWSRSVLAGALSIDALASAEDSLLAVGRGSAGGMLFQSGDQGRTWAELSAFATLANGARIADLAAAGDFVVAVGGDGTQAIVLSSSDGGTTFVRKGAGPLKIAETAAISGTSALIGGYVGASPELGRAQVLRGSTAADWMLAGSPDGVRVTQVVLYGDSAAIAAVPTGRGDLILRTTDGGSSWQPMPVPPQPPPRLLVIERLAVAPDGRAYAVGPLFALFFSALH
jgi:photosystem II stability/assembly factor-like uncharacterized protein